MSSKEPKKRKKKAVKKAGPKVVAKAAPKRTRAARPKAKAAKQQPKEEVVVPTAVVEKPKRLKKPKARVTIPPTHAIVRIFSSGVSKMRHGRGFSAGELDSVGLTISKARKLGLFADLRRKTVVEDNVQALRGALGKTSP